jgi:hypothetical protein
MDLLTGFGSDVGLGDGDDLSTGDHGAEIVPAGAEYLDNMHEEEEAEADGEPEVEPAGCLIAAQ